MASVGLFWSATGCIIVLLSMSWCPDRLGADRVGLRQNSAEHRSAAKLANLQLIFVGRRGLVVPPLGSRREPRLRARVAAESVGVVLEKEPR